MAVVLVPMQGRTGNRATGHHHPRAARQPIKEACTAARRVSREQYGIGGRAKASKNTHHRGRRARTFREMLEQGQGTTARGGLTLGWPYQPDIESGRAASSSLLVQRTTCGVRVYSQEWKAGSAGCCPRINTDGTCSYRPTGRKRGLRLFRGRIDGDHWRDHWRDWIEVDEGGLISQTATRLEGAKTTLAQWPPVAQRPRGRL